MAMKDGFRVRMGLLHTWAGLVFSAFLLAIFWTGTLSVFNKEIDLWMAPETRISIRDARTLSVDHDIIPILKARASGADSWSVVMPRERIPYLSLVAVSTSDTGRQYWRESFHPVSLEPLNVPKRPNATSFLYPFHHNLTMRASDVGAWLIGLASMAMLCLLVSGVVIHRKIFAEFFTLRLLRRFGRANLDIHNLLGVVLLPFVFIITLSGLIVAHWIYFPQAMTVVAQHTARSGTDSRAPMSQADAERRFMTEALGRSRVRPAAGQFADMASIDQMIAITERDWGQGSVHLVRINHPEDANGDVVLRQDGKHSVTRQIGHQRFALASGAPLSVFEPSTAVNAWNFIGGLHYIQFSHWLIRWLYFLGGLGACIVIASGLLHWTQARNKGRRAGRFNVALMNGLTIASVTGLLAATAAFLLAHRMADSLSPLLDGSGAEIVAFYGVWLLCALHAAIRLMQQRQLGHLLAWQEQCWAIALLALAAWAMNWASTGEHLIKTMLIQTHWPVAGVDLVLLLSAAIAIYAARKLGRRARHAHSELAAQRNDLLTKGELP